MKNVKSDQLGVILGNLHISKLIAPFKSNEVDGHLLSFVDTVGEIIDIDREAISKDSLCAKKLFDILMDWKAKGWRVPASFLLNSSLLPETTTTFDSATSLKVMPEFVFVHPNIVDSFLFICSWTRLVVIVLKKNPVIQDLM